MKLRQKSKRDQRLDAAASVAKTWSEWRLGEKVSKTAAKGAAKVSRKKGRKSSLPAVAQRKPVWIAGAIALLGGIGAAVAKKFGGGKAEPLYTPPGPAPDMAPPPASPVAVGDLEKDAPAPADDAPAAGDMPSVPQTEEPALTAPKDVPEPDPSPIVLEDLAGDAPAEAESEASPGDGAPASAEAAPLGEDHPSAPNDMTPAPEDLVSDTADPAGDEGLPDVEADASDPTEKPH